MSSTSVATKIFVPQPIPAGATAALAALGEVTTFPHVDRAITREELLEAVAEQEVLFALGGIHYDEEVLEAAKSLRMIAAMHVFPYYVDVPAATRRGIPVSGIPDLGLVKTTAEFTFAMLLGTAWRLPEADRFLRDGRWQQNQSEAFLGTRLFGGTIGIVGLGGVGTIVARMSRAFGMSVVYTKRTRLSPAEEQAIGAEYRSLRDLFRESDFVVLTPPLTKETKGMVTPELLDLLKPSAILINTSRGAVLDESALAERLAAGRIRGAGLDVFEWEGKPNPGPLPELLSLPSVVLTPHLGSAARQTREEMAGRTVANIAAFLDTGRPIDALNPEVFGEAPLHSERIG
jgi:glyoxylate reductase